MAPDPRSSEEGIVVDDLSSQDDRLNLAYNQTYTTNTAKLNGNVTPIEEQITDEDFQADSIRYMDTFLQKVQPVMDVIDSAKVGMTAAKVEYRNGPDQVLPSEDYITWIKDGSVKLKVGNEGRAGYTPLSIPGLLKHAAQKNPNRDALATKGPNGKYEFTTYAQYYDKVRTTAKAFIKLGLERLHGVCIVGFNSEEWFYAHLGAIFAGGLATGIYTTNSPEASEHCGRDCSSQIWVVEDHKQLEKVLKIKDNLPHLKSIIQYKGKPTVEGVLSWDDLMAIGAQESDELLEERLSLIAVNQCCILIYTSGTTGPSKGVMISHDNATWVGRLIIEHLSIDAMKDVTLLSYLPLSHIAAQAVDIFSALSVCATVYFAQPDALKGSLGDTLRETRPVIFLGVPRVWEKIREKMIEMGKKTTGVKKNIAIWAKSVGLERSLRLQNYNDEKPFGYGLANKLVFQKVKKALGLDKAKLILSAAAPISIEVLQFFHSLNVHLVEIYGMSECTGPHTLSQTKKFKFGSTGITPEGCFTKISNMDNDGNGEICMGGRHVYMGYLNMEQHTKNSIDEDGYFATGDIGKFDFSDRLFITGRIKELIITAGGENVPPILIEDEIKKNLPCISNAMLIGDRRKFISVLLTLKTEINEELEPQNNLTAAALEWCKSIGSSAKTVSEIISEPDTTVMNMIQKGIDETNKIATSNAQKIQKWTLLPTDFSIPGGELGPTLKLKRQIVMKNYADTIEKFYS